MNIIISYFIPWLQPHWLHTQDKQVYPLHLGTDILLPTCLESSFFLHFSFGRFWEGWISATGSMRSLMNVNIGGGACGSWLTRQRTSREFGDCSISDECTFDRRASSSRLLVLSRGPNIIKSIDCSWLQATWQLGMRLCFSGYCTIMKRACQPVDIIRCMNTKNTNPFGS